MKWVATIGMDPSRMRRHIIHANRFLRHCKYVIMPNNEMPQSNWNVSLPFRRKQRPLSTFQSDLWVRAGKVLPATIRGNCKITISEHTAYNGAADMPISTDTSSRGVTIIPRRTIKWCEYVWIGRFASVINVLRTVVRLVEEWNGSISTVSFCRDTFVCLVFHFITHSCIFESIAETELHIWRHIPYMST